MGRRSVVEIEERLQEEIEKHEAEERLTQAGIDRSWEHMAGVKSLLDGLRIALAIVQQKGDVDEKPKAELKAVETPAKATGGAK